MATEPTDAQLVRRVQKGDKGAFDLLVLKYQHKIVNLVMRYVRDQEQALDITKKRLAQDNWPEYYDGRRGDLIGRRANFFQVWSATGLIIAHEVMETPGSRALLDRALITGDSLR